jgi:hypothetical protein
MQQVRELELDQGEARRDGDGEGHGAASGQQYSTIRSCQVSYLGQEILRRLYVVNLDKFAFSLFYTCTFHPLEAVVVASAKGCLGE